MNANTLKTPGKSLGRRLALCLWLFGWLWFGFTVINRAVPLAVGLKLERGIWCLFRGLSFSDAWDSAQDGARSVQAATVLGSVVASLFLVGLLLSLYFARSSQRSVNWLLLSVVVALVGTGIVDGVAMAMPVGLRPIGVGIAAVAITMTTSFKTLQRPKNQ
jgi:hypothetical protein